MRFRQALIAQAEQAHSDGELSRQDLFRIRLATLNPRIANQLEEAAAEQAASQSLLPAGSSPSALGAIDWQNLLSFLRELLPLILQIIKIFSV
jgi:hypothetical protein